MPSQRRFSSHLNSPYSRTPQSPHHSRISHTPKKAPGSIFGKVKQMFSPTVWLSNTEQINNTDNSIFEESDISTVSVSQEPPKGLKTPSNPFNEFKRLQKSSQGLTNDSNSTDSPNVKLAKFFADKGAEPLSEIELEGVQALLLKSQSVVNSPKTPNTSSLEDGDETNVSFDNRLLSADTSKHALNITPSFKATYNTSINSEDSDSSSISNISNFSNTASVFKRRVFDYSGFPSPYRTARLKNYFSTNDLRSHSTSIRTDVENTEKEVKPEPKKLSKTATALLSFIDNSNSDVELTNNEYAKEKETSKFQDFSNPYASHKKSKKPLLLNKNQSAIEQLEKTLDADKASQTTALSPSFIEPSIINQQKPQSEVLNKYKPTKSSSLRESVSLNDESDDSIVKDASVIKEDEKEDSRTNNVSNNAPKLSFGSASTSKPDELPQSVFALSATEEAKTLSNEKNPKPKNSFTFGTNKPIVPPTISIAEEKPSQSAPLFSSGPHFNIKDQGNSDVSAIKPTIETKSVDNKEANELDLTSKDQTLLSSFKEKSVFVFPEATKVVGFTVKDVDAAKVEQFKQIFKF